MSWLDVLIFSPFCDELAPPFCDKIVKLIGKFGIQQRILNFPSQINQLVNSAFDFSLKLKGKLVRSHLLT